MGSTGSSRFVQNDGPSVAVLRAQRERAAKRAANKAAAADGNGHAMPVTVTEKKRPSMFAKRGPEAVLGVVIPKPEVRSVKFDVVGVSPFIMHAFSDKSRTQMKEKEEKRAMSAKAARDPKAEYEACFYYLPDGKTYAFPASGFKKAMVAACAYIDGITKKFSSGAFYVRGTDDNNMVTIHGKPRMQEDMVRIGMGTAQVRYRPYFDNWRATLVIDYNARCITPEQLAGMIENAGFSIGVGDYRPSSPKSPGSNGRFRIAGKGD